MLTRDKMNEIRQPHWGVQLGLGAARPRVEAEDRPQGRERGRRRSGTAIRSGSECERRAIHDGRNLLGFALMEARAKVGARSAVISGRAV